MDKHMVDEHSHSNNILKNKRAGMARMIRKCILDQKKAKRLKTMHKENGSPSDIIHDKEVSSVRSPLSKFYANIPSQGRGISSSVQHSLPNSILNTFTSTTDNIISSRVSRRSIDKLGVNLNRRFDTIITNISLTSSNSSQLPDFQTNELFEDDSTDDHMNGDYKETIVNQDGYLVYRRRDNGHKVVKNGIEIDNRNVVPYNAKLLLKSIAHISME
ncbi:hypothetical protein KIW84_015577 [Lathyrus oleraceus]|uniref:Uncharacterized protein n=1 Tax=Pisum sativum TaxID=3888 RepID=A0A9D5H151_PEA|nr:hypothetical protein KIW84_015577 [Pisum sativum]